ncbi:RNA polymerase sigma-70 factor, ECF subfamily [Bryocella elongata]|uniref:RNA polymerase sigma-70 factor, ECF subfamily n=1 Tax=Bryocella elongata TaxID=863522 RepID=A0A1H6BJC3_9BACT|nr:sigma-70 family RNA polymerase sigma factor [Bryocella elongata]SEG60793.1 RNA polymerase sigma-70 factor, ECF subfamily [Bryocella elongata]
MRRDLTSPEGFESLVREHQGMVFRTLTRMTGAGTHVEDLAQEVFLRLYRALPEFRGEAMLSTYLYRIVVNVAQDEWKRRKKEREHIAEVPAFVEDEGESAAWLENFAGDADASEHARTPHDRMELAEMERALEAELQALPEMERAVIVLYHQEELSYEGIASALSLPVNTVRTHLHRGRKRLGERLRGARDGRPASAPAAAPEALPVVDAPRKRLWRWA